HRPGTDVPHLAVTGDDLALAGERDHPLAAGSVVEVRVQVGPAVAEDDARCRDEIGEIAGGARCGRLQLDLDVLEVRLAIRPGVDTKVLEGRHTRPPHAVLDSLCISRQLPADGAGRYEGEAAATGILGRERDPRAHPAA